MNRTLLLVVLVVVVVAVVYFGFGTATASAATTAGIPKPDPVVPPPPPPPLFAALPAGQERTGTIQTAQGPQTVVQRYDTSPIKNWEGAFQGTPVSRPPAAAPVIVQTATPKAKFGFKPL